MFKPNELKKEDIEALEPWQALVAACHWGPSMGDCVELDYGYTLEDETIYCHDGTGRKISLDDDIDLKDPIGALQHYAGLEDQPPFDILAKQLLAKSLSA